MLISFSQNYNNDPAINLLIIAIISFALSIYASYVNVYKNKFKSILEISFLLNLGFLSITIFYQLVHDKSSILPALLSIGSAFLQFVIIVLYHGVLQVLSLRKINRAKALLSTLIVKVTRIREIQYHLQNKLLNEDNDQGVTHTSAELHESLIMQS